MAAMAAGFELVVRARARATQAARTPAICIAFPATIERRLKILRRGREVEVFIFASDS
jgi:hypothetical protein